MIAVGRKLGVIGGVVDHGEVEILLAHLGAEQPFDFAQRVAEIERRLFEHQLARLDLREVEHIVDERQQRFGGIADRRDVLALFAIELRFERQSREADDRVHRRADFVAHVGEEFAFRLRRRFGDLTTLLGFAAFDARADVDDRTVDHFALIRVLVHARVQRHPERTAVADDAFGFECDRNAGFVEQATSVSCARSFFRNTRSSRSR